MEIVKNVIIAIWIIGLIIAVFELIRGAMSQPLFTSKVEAATILFIAGFIAALVAMS